MPEAKLSAGTIHYEDNNGRGPVLVLTHGLLMDASLWDPVLAELSAEYRNLRPVLPLGAHPHPMAADADLTMRGIAGLLGEFLERLDLHEVTLAVSDWGGRSCSSPKGRPSRSNGSAVSCCCRARRLRTSRPDCLEVSPRWPAGCGSRSHSSGCVACVNCRPTSAG